MRKPFFFQMAVKSFEKKDASDGKKAVVIEGFASTPDIDRYQDIVEPTAFSKALELYMKNPVLLRSHDSDRPAGVVTSAIVTDGGLKIKAEVYDEQTAKEIEDGRMRAMSIGYIPLETELQIKKDDGSMRPFNWEQDSIWGPNVVRVIKTLDLVEISIVATPANGHALFEMAKSFSKVFALTSVKTLQAGKAAEGDETEDDDETDEEAEEEKPAEEAKPEGEKPAEEAEKAADPEKPAEPAAEGAQDQTETEAEGEKPEAAEEAEKGAETAPAESGEGAAEKPAEEPKAEAEPKAEGEEPKAAEPEKKDEKIVLALKECEAIALLFGKAVAAQFVPEGATADDIKAVELPAEVKTILEKVVAFAASEHERAEKLQQTLEDQPAKRSLKAHGKYSLAEKSEAEKKEPSQFFQRLFRLK